MKVKMAMRTLRKCQSDARLNRGTSSAGSPSVVRQASVARPTDVSVLNLNNAGKTPGQSFSVCPERNQGVAPFPRLRTHV